MDCRVKPGNDGEPLAGQHLDGRGVEAGIARRKNAAASARIAALPSGDRAAGTLDDGDQGQDVEGLQIRFDDKVDLPHREKAIIVAVTAEAAKAHSLGP